MLERKIHSRSFYEIARWQLVVFFTILGLLSIPIIKIVTGLFIKDPTIHSVIYIILSICSAVILFCVGCFKDETLIEYVPSKKYFIKKEGEY